LTSDSLIARAHGQRYIDWRPYLFETEEDGMKLGAVAAVVLVVAFGFQAASSAADSAIEPCSDVTNLYAASGAQLAACGYSYAPLTSTTSLPDGGTSYNYALPGGQTTSILQPPAGFNPATASAAEDEAYGIPPAPSPQSAGYADWKALADGTTAPVNPRASLVVGDNPVSGSTSTPNPSSGGSSAAPDLTVNPSGDWSGYGQSGSGWTETWLAYYEPTLGTTHCSNPAVGFWDGIGGYPSGPLGQSGTVSGFDSGALHQLFYENVPAGPIFPGVTAPAGSQVISNVLYNGSNSWSYDMSVGGTNHYYSGTGSYSGGYTEAITEMPPGYSLMNFNEPVTMTSLVGRGFADMNPTNEYTMSGYDTVGGISSGTFTITHDSCSG
jgi:hypothetical protein